MLKHNKHSNNHIQDSYNKYGISNFSFKILMLCFVEELTKNEQEWMDHFRDWNRGLKPPETSLRMTVNNPMKKEENKDKIRGR